MTTPTPPDLHAHPDARRLMALADEIKNTRPDTEAEVPASASR